MALRRLVAVDFDGTCVDHRYPDVGDDVPSAAHVLRQLHANGWSIILWTMRSGEPLRDAEEWFASREIPLFGVNGNPEQSSWTESPKAYAQVYVDDAALGCPMIHNFPGFARSCVDWAAVAELMLPVEDAES